MNDEKMYFVLISGVSDIASGWNHKDQGFCHYFRNLDGATSFFDVWENKGYTCQLYEGNKLQVDGSNG